VNDLTSLNIVGIVEKYKKFYMPTLTGGTKPLPDIDSLVGKQDKSQDQQKPTEKADRWWR